MQSEQQTTESQTKSIAEEEDDDDELRAGTRQQIRVSFRLASEYADPEDLANLVVPSEAIAIPSHLTRKGLSTVLNHLLGREESKEDDESDDDEDEDKNDDDEKAKLLQCPLQFEFLVGPNSRKLLRTTLDKEVRQSGLSLEQAIQVTYFPSLPSPDPTDGEGPQLPDWISALKAMEWKNHDDDDSTASSPSSLLVSACYDGSMQIWEPSSKDEKLQQLASISDAHSGPIQCLDTLATTIIVQEHGTNNNPPNRIGWMATGSMDHTVALHAFDNTSASSSDGLICCAAAQHAASVSSVKFWPRSSSSSLVLDLQNDATPTTMELKFASGDWDGGVLVWSFQTSSVIGKGAAVNNEPSTKKRKTSSYNQKNQSSRQPVMQRKQPPPRLTPVISLQAHNSKVSGLAFFSSPSSSSSAPEQHDLLVTCSWDHSIKVWNLERQDCLSTINTSRVIACLDMSPHSPGICATGHPDCSLRVWDVRVNNSGSTSHDSKNDDGGLSQSTSILVSDSVFRPSHKAWISQVQWSPDNPYQIYSCSHDGTIKIWDIRSPTPLHTVRVLKQQPKPSSSSLADQDKLLALTSCLMSTRKKIYTGGTTCVVEEYRMNQNDKM